jgi:polysaccharide export outer membrane protein
MKRMASLATLTLLLGAGLAIAQEPAGDYRVGPKDLLAITVLELPELNVERRVSDSGSLELPLVGTVPVGGLTAVEVKSRLESMLTSKYVNRANVSVVVKEFANKPVSVLGRCSSPAH